MKYMHENFKHENNLKSDIIWNYLKVQINILEKLKDSKYADSAKKKEDIYLKIQYFYIWQ